MALTKNQEKFLASLKENLGIISKAADACNLHRNSHYKWLDSSLEYKEEYLSIEDDCIDVVEHALMGKILEDKDTTAIIFYLKTKGKKRGYVEKSELDLGSNIIRVNVPE